LENLTEALTWLIGRPVLDQTGLHGTFDYQLEWSPDEMQVRSAEAPPQTEGDSPPIEPALQEQLGLKLLSKKDRVNVLVVENVEKAAAN